MKPLHSFTKKQHYLNLFLWGFTCLVLTRCKREITYEHTERPIEQRIEHATNRADYRGGDHPNHSNQRGEARSHSAVAGVSIVKVIDNQQSPLFPSFYSRFP